MSTNITTIAGVSTLPHSHPRYRRRNDRRSSASGDRHYIEGDSTMRRGMNQLHMPKWRKHISATILAAAAIALAAGAIAGGAVLAAPTAAALPRQCGALITQVRRSYDIAMLREGLYGANDPGTISAWSYYGAAVNNATESGCY